MDLKRYNEAFKRSGLKQYELARAIGVNPSQISRFGSGTREPRASEAQKIADELKVSLPYLMGNGEAEPARKERGAANTFILPEGQATVEYPNGLSSESRAALKEWLEFIAKQASRG